MDTREIEDRLNRLDQRLVDLERILSQMRYSLDELLERFVSVDKRVRELETKPGYLSKED